MADVKVSITGGAELARKLKALGTAVGGEALHAAARAGALPIQNAAKQYAPKRTRNLARSIHTETVGQGDWAVDAEIGTDVVYAAIHEFGGTITPKTASVLHWTDESGQDHFAKSVTLPARPYMRPAFDENIDAAVRETGDVLRVLIERVATG